MSARLSLRARVMIGGGLWTFGLLAIVPVARDAVIEAMADGMMVLDLEDRIVDLNRAAAEILGVTPARVRGHVAWEALDGWPQLVEACRAVRSARASAGRGEGGAAADFEAGLPKLLEESEKGWLEEALRRYLKLTRSQLASKLKISESLLYKKLRQYGITADE